MASRPKRALRSSADNNGTTAASRKRSISQKSSEPRNSPHKRLRHEEKQKAGGHPTDVDLGGHGKVDVVAVSRKSSRSARGVKDSTLSEPQIRRRIRIKADTERKPKADPAREPNKLDPYTWASGRPIGFQCYKDWITEDLEKAIVTYFHHRLKEEGAWEDLQLNKTVKEDKSDSKNIAIPKELVIDGAPKLTCINQSPSNEDGQKHVCTWFSKHAHYELQRKSGRVAHTPSVTESSLGIVGKRLGFAPYTLRDSHCLHAMHCARNAHEPIQISEGRHGQDARFLVEEMPRFMCEIADEIRSECPGELEPPSLDYAQVNVINIVKSSKKDEGQVKQVKGEVSQRCSTESDEGRLEHSQARRRVVLDYHKDHLALGDIAVLCLQGSCTLRMRKGSMEYSQKLHPRTLYLMRGPAREIWEHALDDVAGERISIVFRGKRV